MRPRWHAWMSGMVGGGELQSVIQHQRSFETIPLLDQRSRNVKKLGK